MAFLKVLKKVGKIAGKGALSQVGFDIGSSKISEEILDALEDRIAQGVYRALIAASQEEQKEE